MAAATLLVCSLVDTQTAPELVTIAGTVSGPCSMLDERPTPRVSDVDGSALAGSPWISTSLGSGPCTADFVVTDVPERNTYRVTVGTASREVGRNVVGAVALTT